jgi:hypothetical protein
MLKNFKSRNLISKKREIELFLNKEDIKTIITIKNDRIHKKNKDLITMSFAGDNFKKRFIFCELPIKSIGHDSRTGNFTKFKIEGEFLQIISNTNIARVNIRTKEKLEIFSIYEFFKKLLNYSEIFETFYCEVLKIEK